MNASNRSLAARTVTLPWCPIYDARMARRSRKARVGDVHEVALAMPHVTVTGPEERPVYQVGGKSFVFFRSRRPDAFDPDTGERYADVIVFWVADEGDKEALVEDPSRRTSPRRTSTGTRRCCCAHPGSGSSAATRSPSSCRTPGSPGRRRVGPRTGWLLGGPRRPAVRPAA